MPLCPFCGVISPDGREEALHILREHESINVKFDGVVRKIHRYDGKAQMGHFGVDCVCRFFYSTREFIEHLEKIGSMSQHLEDVLCEIRLARVAGKKYDGSSVIAQDNFDSYAEGTGHHNEDCNGWIKP